MGNHHHHRRVGIIGYGRFGRILMGLLHKDHSVFFYDPNKTLETDPKYLDLDTIVTCETLILAMPISQMQALLQYIGPIIQADTVMDVCSVKVYPTKWMLKYIPEPTHVIATHPMFGPDSVDHVQSRKMMMYPARTNDQTFKHWTGIFEKQDIRMIHMTPDEHDREAAFSQNITHLVGRTLDQLKLTPSPIATQGYLSLLKIIEQTCHDSWELFNDLITYNPYSEDMMKQFMHAANQMVSDIN